MRKRILTLVATGLLATAAFAPAASARSNPAVYEVTLTNLTSGQPLSPTVAFTADGGERLFRVGQQASIAIEQIAEDGNQLAAYQSLQRSKHVTDLIDVAMPVLPVGVSVTGLSGSVTFQIEGRSGDRLSLATMLICTNDGFTGLDRAKLPGRGSTTYYLDAYDAGTEMNTELSGDIVDACSAIGPAPLTGDPNGNSDVAVNDNGVITHFDGLAGGGDLLPAHDWDGPVAMVTITRVG